MTYQHRDDQGHARTRRSPPRPLVRYAISERLSVPSEQGGRVLEWRHAARVSRELREANHQSRTGCVPCDPLLSRGPANLHYQILAAVHFVGRRVGRHGSPGAEMAPGLKK